MKANTDGVELAVEEMVERAFVEFRKSDAENDQRLMEMALRCGNLERQLSDACVQVARLNAENEMLREDLQRERERHDFELTPAVGEA